MSNLTTDKLHELAQGLVNYLNANGMDKQDGHLALILAKYLWER